MQQVICPKLRNPAVSMIALKREKPPPEQRGRLFNQKAIL
jgi:hypothetical protein